MPPRFLITEYAHSWEGDSLYVALTTDVACHLFLRWTESEERVHIREKTIRGVTIMGNPKYCFVEWLEVEQNEPGDTLSHTFNFPSWGPCQTRWWHFGGTIGGVDCISNTGIFSAHYLDQEGADSLLHTDLQSKEVAGVIDHADGSITRDKLAFSPGDFPEALDPSDFAQAYVVPGWHAENIGTGYLTLGRLFYIPIFVSRDTTYDQILALVDTGVAGLARLGLYTWNAGKPGTLVADYGTIDVSSAGTKAVAISETLTRGYYFLAAISDVSVMLEMFTLSGIINPPVPGFEIFASSTPRYTCFSINGQDALVAAGFPATAVAPDAGRGSVFGGLVRLRIAP